MKIDIHQIFYQDSQKKELDLSFLPYDNSESKRPEHCEFYVFRDQWLKGLIGEGYTGYVSWKFNKKTRISGKEWQESIQQNPGYDVYFINPFWEELVWENVWQQACHCHPDLKPFLFRHRSGLQLTSKFYYRPHGPEKMAFCNYWVGNEKFWQRYMEFALPKYDYLCSLGGHDQKFLNSRADSKIEASYIPFITERLFTEFLAEEPAIKAKPFFYTPQQIENRYPFVLRALVKSSQRLPESPLRWYLRAALGRLKTRIT